MEEKDYKYEYFISYSHDRGSGMVNILRDTKIETYDDLVELQKFISENNGLNGIVILNWKQLKHSKRKS